MVKKLNKKPTRTIPVPLTVDNIRQYKGLENISDAKAKNIVHTLRKFSELTLMRFQEEQAKGNKI